MSSENARASGQSIVTVLLVAGAPAPLTTLLSCRG